MTALPIEVARCRGCGSELASSLLSCPACRRLVHAETLASLSARAEEARAADNVMGEIEAWRDALRLLPSSARQHAVISSRLDELGRTAEAQAAEKAAQGPASGTMWAKVLGPLGVAGLLIWKLKFLIVVALSKAKFLFLGLTKGATLFSMLASFGLYWTAWGWRFAAGLVVSIYIHEMGHVAALRRYGLRATAPMFIPGLGAYIRLNEHPATPREDARVGLAGPWWGFGAALAAFAIYFATGSKIWGAIGHTGAWINLFNLLPIWQLDGGRGVNPLSRLQRGLLCALVAVLWLTTREGLLVLILLALGYRTWQKESPRSDWGIFAEFAALLVLLSIATMMHVRP
jgi:Zn-dependent protease